MIDLNNLSDFNFTLPSLNIDSATPPPWVNENKDIPTNLKYSVLALTKMKASLDQIFVISLHKVKSFNKGVKVKRNAADRFLKKLCKLLKVIKFLTKITSTIVKWITDLNNFIRWLIVQINKKLLDLTSAMVQYILGWIQILMLKIKEFILLVKIKIAKGIKKILEGIKNKAGSAQSSALAAGIQNVLNSFKLFAQIAMAILMGIDILLKALPAIIMIDGEAATFYFTPRSIMSTGQMQVQVTAANPNLSIIGRLPLPICEMLLKLWDVIPTINAAMKVTMIAAGAAMGMASVLGAEFDIPPSVCKALQILDPEFIMKQIDNILKALAIPYPLPKYEELLPTTLGFLSFLMTGFCPAGHIAFGFPMYP